MATDITTVSSIISEFRQLKARDSVTPESLGYILQRIVSLVGSVDSDVQLLQERFSSQLSSLSKTLTSMQATDAALQSQLDAMGRVVSSGTQRLSERIGALETSSAEIQTRLSQLAESVTFLLEQAGFSDTSFMEFSRAPLSVTPPTVIRGSAGQYTSVVWLPLNGVFAALGTDGRYYANWETADAYMDESRTAPRRDRLWRCGSDFYFWDGGDLRLLFQQTRHVTLSQEEYDSLTDPDPDTIYFIPEKEQG